MICDLIFIIFPCDWWMQIISVYISMSIPRYIRCAVLCLVAQSCPTLCNCNPPGSSVHRDSPGKNTRVSRHALHQGIFPTQGLNPGLPHCRQIFYHLSHQGSPRILKWLAYPFLTQESNQGLLHWRQELEKQSLSILLITARENIYSIKIWQCLRGKKVRIELIKIGCLF